MRIARATALAAFVAVVACESPAPSSDAATLADSGGADSGRDASATDDAGTPAPIDSGMATDAGSDAARGDAGMRAFGTPVAQGTTPTTLPEISGIVASRAHHGVYWVENDSGNPAEVYAIDETGTLLATITLTGATNRDWEDIALAPGASGDDIYVADVGDNAARDTLGASGRASVAIYRFPEPDPAGGDRALTAETITLRYPTIPHDCEAVFVEATTRDLYLVSKENAPPAYVFVARAPLVAGSTVMLEELGTCDMASATGGDMTRDGSEIVLRNYGQVRIYDVLAGGVAASLASTTFTRAASGSSAEAICFDDADRDLLTVAEGRGATLFRIPRL